MFTISGHGAKKLFTVLPEETWAYSDGSLFSNVMFPGVCLKRGLHTYSTNYWSRMECAGKTDICATGVANKCCPGKMHAYIMYVYGWRNFFSLSMLRAWAVLNCLIWWVMVNDYRLDLG